MVREGGDVRDTSIRIFDTYLISNYVEYPQVLHDTLFLAFSAAASMIISSKLNASRHPMTAVSRAYSVFSFFTNLGAYRHGFQRSKQKIFLILKERL
jgi:hypothetical protein